MPGNAVGDGRSRRHVNAGRLRGPPQENQGQFVKRTQDNPQTGAEERPLLTQFLQRLNVARRKLSLYPPDHPQITDSVRGALKILADLLSTTGAEVLVLGISPRALYYEQIWLDPDDSANRECARELSALGVAALHFHAGLGAEELIRFCQLLRSDRDTIEDAGGFATLMEQQQIVHLRVQAIDYDAFQARRTEVSDDGQEEQLWETFLTALQQGTLDFGEDTQDFDSDAVAEYLNQTLCAQGTSYERSCAALDCFMEQRISNRSREDLQTDRKFNALLQQLSPSAREQLFRIMFRSLDRHHEAAPQLLGKVSPRLLEEAVQNHRQRPGDVSSRLINLAGQLSRETDSRVRGPNRQLDEEMVRSRLDVLFSEEQQDLFMPSSYQQALRGITSEAVTGGIPDEERDALKAQLENHSVERSCVDIIFELLDGALDLDQEDAIQLNLLELSRHFLAQGDFPTLQRIYRHWTDYLNSGRAKVSVFEEKVLTNHAQPSFMAEVLDQIDAEERPAQRQAIADYILTVGTVYSEPLIERLALAGDRAQRSSWMTLLEQLDGDTRTPMIAALDDDRWYLVRNLVILLSRDLDTQVLKAFQKLSGHPHPLVRIETLRALFACNPATANRQLLSELQSDDGETRKAALPLAELSSDRGVLELLHRYLENEDDPLVDLEFKEQLVLTIARIGNPDSLPVLRRLLLRKSLLPTSQIRQLQKSVITSLATFPGASAHKLLKEMHQGRYRRWAGESLKIRTQSSS